MITTEIEYNEALEKIDIMMDLEDPTEEQIEQMTDLAIDIEEYLKNYFKFSCLLF
jgi:phosphoribosylaminoimidazole-succinocarboxamide synthase